MIKELNLAHRTRQKDGVGSVSRKFFPRAVCKDVEGQCLTREKSAFETFLFFLEIDENFSREEPPMPGLWGTKIHINESHVFWLSC